MTINYDQPDYVVKRPRYFDGQFLKVDDFLNEQQYHIDRQRRVSRFLHVSGIVEGLEVQIDGNRLKISPGSAIDHLGRQILLHKTARIGEEQVTNTGNLKYFYLSLENQTEGSYSLIIRYGQFATDRQQEEGSEEETRFHEVPMIALVSDVDRDDAAVVLARVTVMSAETPTVDLKVRQCSGLRLPNGSEEGVTFRSEITEDSRRQAVLSSSLKVTDELEAQNLSVGERIETESLSVTQNSTLQGQLSVNGKLNANNGLDVIGNLTTTENTSTGKLIVRDDAELLGSLTANKSIKVGENLRVDGNFGIGTQNPNAKLEIARSAQKYSVDLIVNGRLRSNDNEGGLWIATDRFMGGLTDKKIGFYNKDWRLLVDSKGYVGIGTESPDRALHIHSSEIDKGLKITTEGANSEIQMHCANNYGFLSLGGNNKLRGGNQPSELEGNFKATALCVRSNLPEPQEYDDFRIYWADAYNISFYRCKEIRGQRNRLSGVYLTGSNDWAKSSDLSLKENIESLDDMLTKIMKLKPVSFTYKDHDVSSGRDVLNGTDKQIGFIAQDVEKIFPDLVTTIAADKSQPGKKCLTYSTFGVLAIAAIQELKQYYDQCIQRLEKQIAEKSI